jgi:iron complex transport system ATP-binding protein
MVEISHLFCYYGKQTVLEDINLKFPKGTFTAVTGLNGSGKSTLLSCIASAKKYKGNIAVDGQSIKDMACREKAQRVSYLPQHVKKVPFTVQELALFGRNPYGDANTENARKMVCRCMDELSINHLKEKRADCISGGELRLSYYAMIVCQNTDIVLLDEAAAGLDVQREEMIYTHALKMCKEQNKTVISVMHNLSMAARFADNTVILEKGKIAFSGTMTQCLENKAFEKNFGVVRYNACSEDENRIFFA